MEQYNYNNPNNSKNLYPYENFKTYQTSLCGVGVKQPTWVGIPMMSQNIAGSNGIVKYVPECMKNGKPQTYNINYTGDNSLGKSCSSGCIGNHGDYGHYSSPAADYYFARKS